MKQFVHPVLGPFQGESWEWEALQPLSFPCAGYSTPNIIIAVDGSPEKPGDAQFQALVDLMDAAPSFRGEIAAAILRAYSREIRPEYLHVLATIPDTNISADNLPDIHTADDVWRLITHLYGIWVLADASVSMDFSVIFDEEHELHVAVKQRKIERVWME